MEQLVITSRLRKKNSNDELKHWTWSSTFTGDTEWHCASLTRNWIANWHQPFQYALSFLNANKEEKIWSVLQIVLSVESHRKQERNWNCWCDDSSVKNSSWTLLGQVVINNHDNWSLKQRVEECLDVSYDSIYERENTDEVITRERICWRRNDWYCWRGKRWIPNWYVKW